MLSANYLTLPLKSKYCGVWARKSNFLVFRCRVSEKKIGEINQFHLENIILKLFWLAFYQHLSKDTFSHSGERTQACFRKLSLEIETVSSD